MTKLHVCRERPGYKEGDDPWVEGSVSGCTHHAQPNRNQPKVQMSKADRAKADKAAGVLGKQNEMGSYTGTPGRDW